MSDKALAIDILGFGHPGNRFFRSERRIWRPSSRVLSKVNSDVSMVYVDESEDLDLADELADLERYAFESDDYPEILKTVDELDSLVDSTQPLEILDVDKFSGENLTRVEAYPLFSRVLPTVCASISVVFLFFSFVLFSPTTVALGIVCLFGAFGFAIVAIVIYYVRREAEQNIWQSSQIGI